MPPEVIAGERPLLAFVSSVMRPEIQWARDASFEALSKNPTLVPWLFEYTPASSNAADTTYLSKVREADFVVWLCSETTTEPVRNEIAEALACRKRLWVVTLPGDRDDETSRLLTEVREVAKTASVGDADELRKLLSLTFSDEVIRALRETPGMTRLALLEQLGRRSRARMVNRWIAAGLDFGESITFADDLTVGAPPARLVPSQAAPLVVVVGDVGSGKSVTAERVLQLALAEAQKHAAAPIPVFLRARDAANGLEAAIANSANELGDYRVSGLFAVVDGADEMPTEVASRLVEDARELAHGLANSRILITSRPIAALRQGVPERVDIPALAPDEARALVGRVAEFEITPGMEAGWPRPVQEAIRRPLFAILMGLNQRRRASIPRTTGELLATLVEGARLEALAGSATLRRLAVLVTDASGPVERVELGELAAQGALVDTRVVTEEDRKVDFALPVLTQWFAAEALLAGEVSVDDLATSQPRVDRWRYALAIALARGGRSFVSTAMNALTSAQPAFAAEIVEESFQRWTSQGVTATPLPDVIAAGRQLRHAFATWIEAIEPLGEVLAPRTAPGKLVPLGIGATNGYLTVAWYRGPDEKADVSELPAEVSVFQPHGDWAVRVSGIWAAERGWEWRWSLDLLRNDLKHIIEERSLRTNNPALIDEALWLVALEAIGRGGSLWHDPISLDQVDGALTRLDPSRPLIKLRDRYAQTDQILDRVRTMREQGEAVVASPWPGPDALEDPPRGGWIWDPYSPEQQLRRAQAVYGAAMDAYTALVADHFPRLKPRMRIATTLPAVIRGSFTPSTPTPAGLKPMQHMDTPTLSWHFDPLPLGQESATDIALTADDPREDFDEHLARVQERQRRLVMLRPDAAGWISTVETHGLADIFHVAPLGPLVYEWLVSDLKAIDWA